MLRVKGFLFGMVFLNILWSASLVFGEDDKEKKTSSLKEIVVTATRTEKKVDDAPASVTVITKKDMEKYDIQTVDDAIKYEPGLYVRRTKGLSDSITSIQMRGLSGQNRTLVLVDGLPVNDGFGGGVPWNEISTENVERIEVIRGPASALYGGNAMGGVINIITTTPKKREASAWIGYGGDDSKRYGAVMGDRFADRLSVRLGVEGEETGGYPTNLVTRSISKGNGDIYGGYPTQSTSGASMWVVGDTGDNTARRLNLNLKAVYDYSKTGSLGVELQSGRHEYGYDPPHTYLSDRNGRPVFSGKVDTGGSGYADVSPSNYIAYTGISEEAFNLYAVTYKEDFNLFNLTGRLGYEHKNKWYTNSKGTKDQNYWNAPGTKSDADYDSWFLDLQTDVPIGEKHLVTLGFYSRGDEYDGNGYDLAFYRDEDSKVRKTDITKGKARSYAFYIQEEWRPIESVTLYGGVRADLWNAYDGISGTLPTPERFKEPSDSSISPKVSAVWNFLKDTYLRASIGKAFRPPTLYELYRTWSWSAGTYHSNPSLGPETLWNYEAGLDQYLLDRRLRLSATAYHTDAYDLISTYWVGRDNYKDNLSRARINGIELEADVIPVKWLRFWGNYAYNQTRVIKNRRNPAADGKRLTGYPVMTMNLGVEFTYRWVKASIAGQYLGRTYDSELNNDVQDVYGGNSRYWLWDTKLTLTPVKHIEVSFSVENMFNQGYFEYYKGPDRQYWTHLKYVW